MTPTTRSELPTLLPENSIGVELGVASGKFSEELLTHNLPCGLNDPPQKIGEAACLPTGGSREAGPDGRFFPIKRLYSIDAWEGDRGHDIRQYAAALDRLAPFGDRSRVIRARFAEALPLFEDQNIGEDQNHREATGLPTGGSCEARPDGRLFSGTLDFVYIDGYAHQGNEAGQTLRDWWAKVKPGGILAGHDYHPDWPKNIRAVDQFRAEREKAGEVADFCLTEADRYPSWVVFKV